MQGKNLKGIVTIIVINGIKKCRTSPGSGVTDLGTGIGFQTGIHRGAYEQLIAEGLGSQDAECGYDHQPLPVHQRIQAEQDNPVVIDNIRQPFVIYPGRIVGGKRPTVC